MPLASKNMNMILFMSAKIKERGNKLILDELLWKLLKRKIKKKKSNLYFVILYYS